MNIRPLLLAFCLATPAFAADTEPTSAELMKQFQDQLKKVMAAKSEEEAKAAKSDSGKSQDAYRAAAASELAMRRDQQYVMYLAQLNAMLRRTNARDTAMLDEMLGNLTALTDDPDVLALANKLAEQLKKEAAARQEAAAQQTKAQIATAMQVCLTAKEPKDLDASILSLAQLSRRGYDDSDGDGRSSEKVRQALNFLCKWQDALQAQQAGTPEVARKIMRELAGSGEVNDFVPRSELLARAGGEAGNANSGAKPKPSKDSPSLSGKSVVEIIAMKPQVREMMAQDPGSSDFRQLYDNINALERARAQVEDGLLGQPFSFCVSPLGNNGDTFFTAQQELLLTLLPNYLGVGKDYAPQPKENAPDYLQRIAADARKKGDWLTYWKALETYRAVAFNQGNPPAWLQGQIQSASTFVQALNYEKAGQYTEAVRAFRRVASGNGQDLPIAEATARLDAIKKDHPEDYEAALKPMTPATTSPQGRTYPPGYPVPQQ